MVSRSVGEERNTWSQLSLSTSSKALARCKYADSGRFPPSQFRPMAATREFGCCGIRAAAAAARKRAGVATACYSRGRARVEVEEEAEQQQQSQEHPRFEQTSHVASIAMWWRGGIVDAGGHFKVDRVMPISFLYFSLSLFKPQRQVITRPNTKNEGFNKLGGPKS